MASTEALTGSQLLECLPRPDALSTNTLREIAKNVQTDMGKALDHEPGATMQMLNTRIPAALFTTKPIPGTTCLTIDCGGTGPKFAVYQVNSEGQLEIKKGSGGKPLQAEGSFNDRTVWTMTEFLQNQGDFLEKELGADLPAILKSIDAMSYIFSFPADPELNKSGIDVQTKGDHFTKNWEIHGITAGGPVGKQLLAYLKARFLDADTPLNPTLLVENDTVALLKPDDDFAGVCATRFNDAVVLENGTFNTESGGFDCVELPVSELLRRFDATTKNPGKQIAEKLISGYGVGGQFREFLKLGCMHNLLDCSFDFETFLKDTDTVKYNEVMSALLGQKEMQDKYTDFIDSLKPEQFDMVIKAAKALIDTSVQVHAAMILGLAQQAQMHGPQRGCNIFTVPIEGSFFWKTPEYVSKLTAKLQELNPELEFNFTGWGKRIGLEGGATQALCLHAMVSAPQEI